MERQELCVKPEGVRLCGFQAPSRVCYLALFRRFNVISLARQPYTHVLRCYERVIP